MEGKRAEVAKMRADAACACPPILVMEVAEVTDAVIGLVKVTESDVEADGVGAEGGGPEALGCDFDTGLEADGPLNDIALTVGEGLGDASLMSLVNPLLVRMPCGVAGAGFAFEQAAGADAAEAGFGEVADHLPACAISGDGFICLPGIGGVQEDLHFVAEPGIAALAELMCVGVVGGKPAGGMDPVEHVVGNAEGEIELLAVVLDEALEG